MKKCFICAGILAVFLSSCSKDDGLVSAGQEQSVGAAVESLKLSLVSGTATRSGSDAGVGTENKLSDSYIFVQCDEDGPNASSAYDYKYKYILLENGKASAVVKYVKPGSKIYVYANAPYMDKTIADATVEAANAGDPDELFESIGIDIAKPYIVKLNTTSGKFMMTGNATVPEANGTTAVTLPIGLKRDLAKVEFKIKKKGASGAKAVEIVSVDEVTIRRSAPAVQPFAMDGLVATTYVLPFGFGHSSYVQDGLQSDGNVFKPNNETKTEGATDYSFIYGNTSITTEADNMVLDPFYVLPNAAKQAEKSTIIVLKAQIKEKEGENAETTKTKYYKARISSGSDAYDTKQNAKYVITATIKGEGSDAPAGPNGPDAEQTENDLNIDVKVEPWAVVISDQEIG